MGFRPAQATRVQGRHSGFSFFLILDFSMSALSPDKHIRLIFGLNLNKSVIPRLAPFRLGPWRRWRRGGTYSGAAAAAVSPSGCEAQWGRWMHGRATSAVALAGIANNLRPRYAAGLVLLSMAADGLMQSRLAAPMGKSRIPTRWLGCVERGKQWHPRTK